MYDSGEVAGGIEFWKDEINSQDGKGKTEHHFEEKRLVQFNGNLGCI